MIHDPFFLAHIVKANAEIAIAIENMDSEEPNYVNKSSALIEINRKLELLIINEVNQ